MKFIGQLANTCFVQHSWHIRNDDDDDDDDDDNADICNAHNIGSKTESEVANESSVV